MLFRDINTVPTDPLNLRRLKHREVTLALRQEISSGLYTSGERLPGEQELAKRFGVAYTTLRQAIATLVSEGILHRVQGKGTFIVERPPDAPPAASTIHPMALLFPADAHRIDPYYFPDVLSGFQQAIDAGGHRMSLYAEDVADSGGILEPGSAVAFLMFDASHIEAVERLRDSGYKVLAINRYTGRRSIPSVSIDDAQGVGAAVNYLVEAGHRKIGFVAGPTTNLDANDRLTGFRAAIRRNEIKQAPEAGSGFNEAAGYEAAQQLLDGANRPTAIICASDLAAIGVIRAATDCGLSVPRALSVVGFGDFSMARYMSPSLTTIRQNRHALGEQAAQALIALASDNEFHGKTLPAELILRESTSGRAAALAPAN